MAKLEDVFAQEWDRENPAEWNKIHLYKMGDFWRAYEWSAWLIFFYCPYTILYSKIYLQWIKS